VIDVKLVDGHGGSNAAMINGEGELNVVVHPHPPKDEAEHPIPFRQYFTTDGTSAGSKDMLVNGSSTEQKFWIGSNSEYDTYINSVSVVIADASATLNKFGNLTALSNGVKIEWVTNEFGTRIIADAITTNFEFMRLAAGYPAFGNTTNTFRANNVSGTSEAYIPHIDFKSIFGMSWGFRLRKKTTDQLVFTIRDDVSGMDQFDAIGYGILF